MPEPCRGERAAPGGGPPCSGWARGTCGAGTVRGARDRARGAGRSRRAVAGERSVLRQGVTSTAYAGY